MFIFFLAFDLLFSLVSILLTWLVSYYFVGRSVWFAINAKEGDCWKMIEYCLRRRLLKKECLCMCFNHYFVTDVKPTICWDDNCLYDPSTIN